MNLRSGRIKRTRSLDTDGTCPGWPIRCIYLLGKAVTFWLVYIFAYSGSYKTGSLTIDHIGLELAVIFLSQAAENWDYRHEP